MAVTTPRALSTPARRRVAVPVLRGLAGLVGLGLLLVAVIDLSAAWRSRESEERALTALTEAATSPGELVGVPRCTLVGMPEPDPPVREVLCAAKRATHLPGVDVRLLVRREGEVIVACAMTHRRSLTGVLGVVLDEVTTARRVVATDDRASLPPIQEAPFVGSSWAFCD